jgi:F-type H+-transporting ATPase subunit b
VELDWFTLVSQVINFLVLLYLLKRFLYGPVIEAMEQREQKIAARLTEAEEKRSLAEEQARKLHQQRQEWEDTRSEHKAELEREIEQHRKELLDQAQTEINQKKKDWQTALKREQDAFIQDLSQKIGREAGEIARRALKDLADYDLEERMASLFLDHLQEIDADEKTEIANSIRAANGKAVIHSTFELREETRETLTHRIREHLLDGEQFHPRFRTAPELISGIELKVDGYQVAWNIQDYLASLESRVSRAIQQEIKEQQEVVNGE